MSEAHDIGAAGRGWLAALGKRLKPASLEPAERLLSSLEGRGLSGTARSTLDILLQMEPDVETVCAALCYMADLDLSKEEVSEGIRQLTRDVRGIRRLAGSLGGEAGAEGLRRLLLAVVSDVRVVLIAMSEQLARMREATRADAGEKERLARETNEVWAPLANRLGIWQVKWELEDLSFRFLNTETYLEIAKLLDERRSDREAYITQVINLIKAQLTSTGIHADVAGRPKHIFSIWRKMQRKQLDFHQLFDIRAVRILVDNIADCYAALGLVHGIWQHIPGEFDDYIATPKGNDYRSLHTAVVGPKGKTLEVQIRTHEMHQQAELGVAAHWRYKEGGKGDQSYEKRVSWMRQLLEAGDDEAMLAEFRSDFGDERVYVLTPRGEVKDLPQGATVLDFAYHIHTGVGHRCRGAKVNGRIVPLAYQLRTGERVEILTGKEPEPSRDWLSSDAGYLNTGRARAKVRGWFRKLDFERNLAAGQDLLEKAFRRHGLGKPDVTAQLAVRFNMRSSEDLIVAVATGEVSPGQVIRFVTEGEQPKASGGLIPTREEATPRSAPDDVMIEGVGNLMTSMARCCKPVMGDPIVGYITRGRGVTIHRADCKNALRLAHQDPSRVIEVDWGGAGKGLYSAVITITAYDRKGLIKDISAALSNEQAHVTAMDSKVDEAEGRADLRLTLQVHGHEQLNNLLSRIMRLPNVIDARRVGQ